jgi:hypothetical protein
MDWDIVLARCILTLFTALMAANPFADNFGIVQWWPIESGIWLFDEQLIC